MLYVSDSQRNGKIYNGTTRKFGITIQGTDYIIKLPKESLSVPNEYVASNFVRNTKILPCQEVGIGEYNGVYVNIIKDFTSGTKLSLHSFKDTKQSSEDTDMSDKNYSYQDVLYLIDKHLKMSEEHKLEAKKGFWRMFIFDAILANRDRHWGNWGYLSNGSSYRFAPLYDNGSCLYPNVDKVISQYYSGDKKKFLKERVFTFPASLFTMYSKVEGREKRTNYHEMFSDLRVNRVFAEQVKMFRSYFDGRAIFNIAYNTVCNREANIALYPWYMYKEFYINVITLRYMCIVLREDFDYAYNRVENWLSEVNI